MYSNSSIPVTHLRPQQQKKNWQCLLFEVVWLLEGGSKTLQGMTYFSPAALQQRRDKKYSSRRDFPRKNPMLKAPGSNNSLS